MHLSLVYCNVNDWIFCAIASSSHSNGVKNSFIIKIAFFDEGRGRMLAARCIVLLMHFFDLLLKPSHTLAQLI